jgi:hypothetical protein
LYYPPFALPGRTGSYLECTFHVYAEAVSAGARAGAYVHLCLRHPGLSSRAGGAGRSGMMGLSCRSLALETHDVVLRLWPLWQYATVVICRRILPGRTLYLHLCLRHPGLSSRTSGAGKNVWHLHLCLRYGAGRSGGAELLAIQALAVYLHLILGFRKKGLGSQLETASPVTVPGRGTKHPRQTAKPAVQLTRMRRSACDYATRT